MKLKRQREAKSGMTSRKIPPAEAALKAQQDVERARRKYKRLQAAALKNLDEATDELERIVGRHALQAVHDDPQGTAAQVVGLLPRLSVVELRHVETWWRIADPAWLPPEVRAAFSMAFEAQPAKGDLEALWPHVLKQAQDGALAAISVVALRREFGVSQKTAQKLQERLLETGLFQRGGGRRALQRVHPPED